MAGSRTWASALALLLAFAAGEAAAARRRPAPRFSGRLQVLSGAAFALPRDAADQIVFSAYVPLDVELSLRVSGPLSLSLGGAGYAAPFSVPSCAGDGAEAPTGGRRPHALAAYGGLRLDLNNSRDGSWLSPFFALRVGVSAQDGVPVASPGLTPGASGCTERVALGAFFSPRAGLDLWLGPAAVTFAVGYDVLPRASAALALLGLTLRLF